MQSWRQFYRDRIAPIEGWVSRIRLYVWFIAAFVAAITMLIGFAQDMPPYWVIPAALAAFALIAFISNSNSVRSIEPTLPRTIPLLELCRRANHLINLDVNDNGTEILEFASALRQAGADGTLEFYGNELADGQRPSSSPKFAARMSILSKICPEKFKGYSFEILTMMMDNDNLKLKLYTFAPNKSKIYMNIHVEERLVRQWLRRCSRSQVDYFKSLRE